MAVVIIRWLRPIDWKETETVDTVDTLLLFKKSQDAEVRGVVDLFAPLTEAVAPGNPTEPMGSSSCN